MELSEIWAILAAYDTDPEEQEPTFELARDSNSVEVYADAVDRQVTTRGVLWSACADTANALGACDYDEAVWALDAVARQWHRVADELDSCDPLAIRVRMAAVQLHSELTRDDIDLEMLPDLIAICALDDELRNHAAASAIQSEHGQGDSYALANADRIREAFGLLCALKADLRDRGELGLDDEVLPPDVGE